MGRQSTSAGHTATVFPSDARTRSLGNIRQSVLSIAVNEFQQIRRKDFLNSKEGLLLRSFRHNRIPKVALHINNYFRDECSCDGVAFMNVLPNQVACRIFCANEHINDEKYPTKMFPGVEEALDSPHGTPILLTEKLEAWKHVFQFLPLILVMIPVIVTPKKSYLKAQFIKTVAVFAYITPELPHILTLDESWHILINACRLFGPYANTLQHYHTVLISMGRVLAIYDALRKAEQEIQNISACIYAIGEELQGMFKANHSVVFVLHADIYEPLLLKYGVMGNLKIDAQCPDKECHLIEEIPQGTGFPAGWCALHEKYLRINEPSQLEKYCGHKGPLHAIGGCIVKNIMCIYVDEHSTDMPLVIELSDKPDGFTDENETDAKLFAKLVSHILSSAVMLDYRKKAIRQSTITNELLNNIKTIQFMKVKHVLDMRFQYSNSFQKRFHSAQFVLSRLSPEQYPGVILYMFTELGFINRWKIRRVTLIRFILCIKQGYLDNPYHNWKHACTVTHFAFYLLRKMELQREGYVTDMEGFSLMVACLCHDIAHRGMNNHFSTTPGDDPYHLYRQEESLVERHHVAVSLQILATDDCNITENLTDQEYRDFIELVQMNIIATDIGKYLQEKNDLFTIMEKFNKKKKHHRHTFMALMMTTCDLCECIKPWDYYIINVKNIFSEFFMQGDEELRVGFEPTPIMDRRIAYIPYIEMKFINEIVRPVYEVIARLLPKTVECLETIDYFKNLWLVATKVFDENISMINPLEVLELWEMEEANLKSEDNPQLERQAKAIRKSIRKSISRPSSVKSLAFGGVGSGGTLNMTDLDKIGTLPKHPMEKAKKLLLDIFCCMKCRRKGLRDADFVRLNQFEIAFLEQRNEAYCKRRSHEFSHKIDRRNVRERISNLINPKFI